MRLQDTLLLFNYITDLLSRDYDDIAQGLKTADEGPRPDGQSNFYTTFEARASRLTLDPAGAEASLHLLKRFDLNVLSHEAALRKHRPGFHLKYFQYLAALYTEIYLHRLTKDRAGLLLALNDHRQTRFPHLPPYTPEDLYKQAFWMATASGKTLLMHINLRQFAHYRPLEVHNTLLLTPSETLSRQHLKELRQSGFKDAVYALDAGAGHRGVQVLEITKLYVDGAEARQLKGGVSLPTSVFEGPNLLLVDEGHKGTATKRDREAERAWRDIRAALVRDGGFTLEYSATFAQVTESDEQLLNEYARAIVFDYGYRRFHADGYGKDFGVVNLQRDDTLYGDTLLLGGLLTFYEQHRVYADQPDAIRPYNIAPPLMVFVGAHVTGGQDVLNVVKFLDRVLRDPAWAVGIIANLLEGQSGLSGQEDGRDVFANAFRYLNTLGLTSGAIYDDLCARLFGGRGPLNLHLLRLADGEVGLRTTDSATDAYCGVVNVGDAPGFLRKARRETDVTVGIEDHVTDSLFDAIEDDHSPISFLIGSKKFIEGWSSWRVSVMGLLRVGRNAGAQVLQLFGRGVRLKGLDMSLQRSKAMPDTHPTFLPLLETLNIFGLRANYLETFLTTLDREGVKPPVTRLLPLSLMPSLDQVSLRAVEVSADYHFKNVEVVVFEPDAELRVAHDLTPRLIVGDAATVSAAEVVIQPEPLPQSVLDRLPYEDLFYHALAYKAAKGWDNLYIHRSAIQDFFRNGHATVAAPSEVLALSRPEHSEAMIRVAHTLLERGIETFYYRQQRRAETEQMVAAPIDSTHVNFPRLNVRQDGKTVEVEAYELKVPSDLLQEVEAIINDQARRLQEALDEPVPRLYLDFHLYWPLLLKDRAECSPTGRVHFKNVIPRITSTPAGLVQSEVQFAFDLRAFWHQARKEADWDAYNLYLLRNLSKRGIGFFQTVGFYPDFLLWLKRDDQQALAFVDPKGLAHGSWEKVDLMQYIRALTQRVGFPVFAYIVSPTPLEQISIPDVALEDREEWLRARSVLRQKGDYIEAIIGEMQQSVTALG